MSLVTKGLKVLGRSGEKKAARKGAEELAVRKVPVKPKAPVKSDLTVPRKAPAAKPKPKPKALPAPEKRLALPAPGPGLPDYAAKPRGGQWFPKLERNSSNVSSPEEVVEGFLRNTFIGALDQKDQALKDWFEKAATKYIKRDFGSPEDPILSLADQGLLHIPGGGREDWLGRYRALQRPDPEGPAGFELGRLLPVEDRASGTLDPWRQSILQSAPWLGKAPVTDRLYSLSGDPSPFEFGHLVDEMSNALRAEEAGLPADLAVRPESLARMSFPQAVERVGRINQWRAKEAERAALSALDSPAIQVSKEYPENNPGGLRWVELTAPAGLPPGYSVTPEPEHLRVPGRAPNFEVRDETGKVITVRASQEEAEQFAAQDYGRPALQEALKYEGDVMGHCVGGYCDDVLSGRSRIFSLRDARGEPHVTIETAPGVQYRDLEHAADEDPHFGSAWNMWRYGPDLSVPRPSRNPDGTMPTFEEYLKAKHPELLERFNQPPLENIVQIKGKQNQAPKADYLPYVQDFVKSGQWGEIGDIANTGLVRLPDKRLVNADQFRQGIRQALTARSPVMPDEDLERHVENLSRDMNDFVYSPYFQNDFLPYFEGFAVGGRVRNNLAVRGR